MPKSPRGVASYLVVGAVAMATGAGLTWLATRPRLDPLGGWARQ